MSTKKTFRVFGHTDVTVSTLVTVDVDEDDDTEEIEQKVYDRAAEEFSGIQSYAGNGGLDKLIGVDHDHDSIAADEDVEWDDFEDLS